MNVAQVDRERAFAVFQTFVEMPVRSGRIRGVRVRLSEASPSAVNQLVRAAWACKVPSGLSR